MTEQHNFTDEQLVAFLDGEFDHTPADEIKAAMAHSDALNARLKQLTLNKSTMSDAFGALSQTAPSYDDIMGADNTKPANDNAGFLKIAAVALIALGVGFFASSIIKQDKLDGWQEYVAAYQALYATDTLAHVNNDDLMIENELKRVSEKIDAEITIADLEIDEGLTYKRGQLLEYQGRPLVQLAFLSSDGKPIALCIMKSQTSSITELNMREIERMQSAYWSDGNLDYFLIGPVSESKIEGFATAFSQRL
ncbi:MAG: hypothetical protein ABJO57_06125 [Lentilitoribacter sp.]